MEQQRLQQLIDKVLKGRASAQEQQELDEWYAAQDTGKGLTNELDEAGKKAMGKDLFGSIHERIENEAPARSKTWMIAAAVALLLAVGAVYFFVKKTPASIALASVWKVERTGQEVRTIRLPDGSSVWLNAGSSLRYDSNFVSGKRELWLQGEAFFDVAAVAAKPFEVHTGKLTTRVLGTAFNIDAYSENITVFVKRGKVSVTDSVHTPGILLPNQKMVYSTDGAMARYDSVDVDYAAWTSGQLVFRDMPFSEVAKRLERKYDIKLIFKDTGIGQCRITASFNKGTPLKDMLDMLAITNGSQIEAGENANTYLITGKKQCK